MPEKLELIASICNKKDKFLNFYETMDGRIISAGPNPVDSAKNHTKVVAYEWYMGDDVEHIKKNMVLTLTSRKWDLSRVSVISSYDKSGLYLDDSYWIVVDSYYEEIFSKLDKITSTMSKYMDPYFDRTEKAVYKIDEKLCMVYQNNAFSFEEV